MSIYIDRKYIGQIQYKLDRFSQKKTDLYNFRCPYCLDSKKNQAKARGYIYRKDNDYFYRCHNCGAGTTFGNLLKHLDSNAYKQYALERYAEGTTGRNSVVKQPSFDELKGNAFERLATPPKKPDISSISELPENHFARDYILNRRIPSKFWNEIYYTDKFKTFMDTNFPDHGKKELPDDQRIVLFYTDKYGNITNVAGRSLSRSDLRYITIKVSDEKKLFGTHRLDTGQSAIVVEGQFDSLFLDNCVASGDSNLTAVADYFPDTDWTLVFDNEPRNKEIVRQISHAIDGGYRVVIFPSSIEQKDINDMVQAGIDVKQLVKENACAGAMAKLKFMEWKRV